MEWEEFLARNEAETGAEHINPALVFPRSSNSDLAAWQPLISPRVERRTGVGIHGICLNSAFSLTKKLPKELPKGLLLGATLFRRLHLPALRGIDYKSRKVTKNALINWVFEGLLRKWRREGDSNPRYGF